MPRTSIDLGYIYVEHLPKMNRNNISKYVKFCETHQPTAINVPNAYTHIYAHVTYFSIKLEMGVVANKIDARWTASSQRDPTAFQACQAVPILHIACA